MPLRDGDNALMLNGCELTLSSSAGKTLYQNAWMTTPHLSPDNVAQIATAGRARWQIENENHKVLIETWLSF
ncbi:MAG: hypothetical protein HC877_10985 [Thioploca sp.]|nr:hypothetical protein [Thioploca sp.]